MRVRWVGWKVSFVAKFWRKMGRDKREGPPRTRVFKVDEKWEESESSGKGIEEEVRGRTRWKDSRIEMRGRREEMRVAGGKGRAERPRVASRVSRRWRTRCLSEGWDG